MALKVDLAQVDELRASVELSYARSRVTLGRLVAVVEDAIAAREMDEEHASVVLRLSDEYGELIAKVTEEGLQLARELRKVSATVQAAVETLPRQGSGWRPLRAEEHPPGGWKH